MKKILIVFLLSVFSINSFSQKCDFFKNEVDDMTGEYSLITKPYAINKKFTSTSFFTFTFSYVNDPKISENTILFVEFAKSGLNSLLTKEGDEFIIKLNNGDKIIVNAEILNTTKFSTVSTVSSARVTNGYYLNDEMLNAIKDTGISKIRMHTSDSYYDSDVSDKDNKKLKDIITCFFNNRPQ